MQWLTMSSRRHPFVVDTLLAVALFLAGLAGARVHDNVTQTLLLTAMCGPLVFRRKYPVAVFVIVAGLGFVQYLLNLGIQPADDLTILVAMYTVAAHRGRREAIAAFGIVELGAVLAAWRWASRSHEVAAFFSLTIVAAAGLLLGETMRIRRAYLLELEERAERLERERDQQAQIAVAAERQRIARELHDIVAHNVSVMVAQADGAGFAMDADPEAARAAMGVVADTGREALTEMRRLLGVLRDTDAPDGNAPQPGVNQIVDLVDRVRQTGLTVELEVQGDPRPMAAGLQLAAYRIVQEALTNTIKHAGRTAHARVELSFDDLAVEVRVADDGPSGSLIPGPAGAGTGQGLVGMRERAAIYGGAVSIGTQSGGGYEVVASFPLAGRGHVIRIALVDDQAMLRMGFRMVLEAQPDMQVVGEAGDGEEAIALVERVPVDVVLMDVRMPNLDGVAATGRITRLPDAPRVLILTTFDLDEYVYAGLRAGVSGFLLKDVPPAELLHGIRVLAAGDAVVAPAVTRRLLDKFAHRLPAADARAPLVEQLTAREHEVLLEVAQGQSNAEIAARLYLSEATVKTHVAHILMKLGLRDRVQAVVFAYETGLVTPSPT